MGPSVGGGLQRGGDPVLLPSLSSSGSSLGSRSGGGIGTQPVAALSPLPVASSRARLPPGPGRSLWRFGGPSGDVEGTPP